MLIVEVKHGNVDRALKVLRRKVKLTKQTFTLRQNKNFIKKSERRRLQIQKAVFKQKRRDEED
jgi:small subunit ribosomal protein S21